MRNDEEFLQRLEDGLELGAQDGLFESWVTPAGEVRWKLTAKGQRAARKVYERMGVDPDAPDPEGEGLRSVLLRIDAEEQAASS